MLRKKVSDHLLKNLRNNKHPAGFLSNLVHRMGDAHEKKLTDKLCLFCCSAVISAYYLHSSSNVEEKYSHHQGVQLNFRNKQCGISEW